MDVITTVLILLEVIIALVWMDMYWNQIIILVQVMTTLNVHASNVSYINYKNKIDIATYVCNC